MLPSLAFVNDILFTLLFFLALSSVQFLLRCYVLIVYFNGIWISLLRIYTWWRSERNCLNIFLSLERLNALDSWNGEIITRSFYIFRPLHKRGEFTFVGLKLKNSARLLRWRLADSKSMELVDDLTLRSIDDIQLMMMTTSTATSEKHEQTSRACASKTSRNEKRDEVEKKVERV